MQTEPPKADPPKRKRRWFQFSLRTLLIFTLICAIPCAWLGRRIEQKRRERDAVSAIRTLGGSVTYDYEPRAEPFGPAWLRQLFGDDFFSEVVEVSLAATKVTDGDLKILKEFHELTDVNLYLTKVSNAGIAFLKPRKHLGYVDLDQTNVTDAGIRDLRRALPTCFVVTTQIEQRFAEPDRPNR